MTELYVLILEVTSSDHFEILGVFDTRAKVEEVMEDVLEENKKFCHIETMTLNQRISSYLCTN